ncbi:DUF4225 domain-containing protein [Pseudomonas entomophila]|uniref:DUF4225 domain-containing protein n=1 Tax=Pseudomonas entomophila TaxID=312306 RepID=UPI0023D7DA0D|nr:DUF4225 domain-containing protein [Pseudomonas entomophila]MDF0733079.1 DUF4225 domain-containing protein [Pseudomonas entomophila]
MNSSNKLHSPSNADFWEVSHAAAELTHYACEIGARYVDDDVLRMQFTQEVAYVGKTIVDEVQHGAKTPAEGMAAIQAERIALGQQVIEYLRLIAGFTSGALQVGTGVAVCQMTAGVACGLAGLPMMLHGLNNMYENGRNIALGRNDSTGPVREGYQQLSAFAGGTHAQGNVAYGVGDLGLSIYGLFRLVLKPGAWRLFRYLEADKVRAHKVMGTGPLVFEIGIDMMTGEQVYVELNK